MNKPSFVMYVEHGEQMESLTMEQRGIWITAIYDYVRYGKAEIDDPVVKMLFTTNRQHLDRDAKKYEERIRKCSEAGKRGGRPRKQELDTQLDDAEKGMAFLEKRSEGIKADNVYEYENGNGYENGNANVNEYENENDLMNSNSSRRLPLGGESREQSEAMQEIIFYGEEQIPTTRTERQKSEALARELFSMYLQKSPSRFDMEKVFARCYYVAETPDGQNYAAFSREKADLLRFVMKQASEQGNGTWRYMDGIFDNYERRGVRTVEDAISNEYRWNRGEIA